jgi:hypothetical protein
MGTGGVGMAAKRAMTEAVPIESPDAGAETDQERLAEDLKRLLALLEDGHVEAARAFVKELEQRWPDAERVQHYAHVLAPPKVRMRSDIPPRSREREWKWLQEHGHEYPGCWLSVYEDRLIAADPDRRVVVASTRKALGEESALLFHQPGSPESQ